MAREDKVELDRGRRGAILEYAYQLQDSRGERLDDTRLWVFMQGLNYEIGLHEVISLLCDLKDRECLRYERKYNEYLRRWKFSNIELTVRGKDIVQRLAVDVAIRID